MRLKNWIDSNLKYKSCLIVLIGSETASSRWVRYEIRRAWELNLGIFGVRIHNLKDQNGETSSFGRSPFMF